MDWAGGIEVGVGEGGEGQAGEERLWLCRGRVEAAWKRWWRERLGRAEEDGAV